MIVGIGVDVVNVPRFGATLRRTPGLLQRVFTERERSLDDGTPRTVSSLAVRFAAKEAVAKALGSPGGLRWHDCEVLSQPDGCPRLVVTGSVADVARRHGVDAWHVSLSHDADVGMAYVVAESAGAAVSELPVAPLLHAVPSNHRGPDGS